MGDFRRPLALFVTMAVAAACLSAAPQNAESKDGERIQGRWKYVSVLEQGKEQPMPQENRVEITPDLFKLVYPDEERGWKYTIDPSKNPKEMDWIVEIDPGHPIRQLAIYSLEGDTLTVASAAAGKPRPTTFESKKGDFGGVMVLRREAAAIAQAR
jgi:uncharacterized protein (TIGR03067 family)